MPAPLRDRNRMRVRREIRDAAWRLFADRGYDQVTTDEIAAAAGVSPSTYYRHVPTKEDLLLAPLRASSAQIVAGFRARPGTEPVGPALSAAIRDRATEDDDDEVARWKAAMLTAPEIAPRVRLIEEADRAALVEIASERLGVPADELRPAVIVHVILSAAEFAYRRWLTDPDAGPLLSTIGEALDIAAAGDVAAASEIAAARDRS